MQITALNRRLRCSQPLLALGWLLLGLSWIDPARAQLGGADLAPPRDPVIEYLDAIERSETEGGAYSPNLIDLYLGLGQTLLENLEYARARDAFHRSVLITRVNSGPNSPEQTNSLFMIADVANGLGDWDEAVEVMDSICQINASYYGETHIEMLPVLKRVFEWYMAHRPLDSETARYEDFERAMDLAEKMTVVADANFGLGNPWTSAAYRTLGQLHFLTVRYVLSRGISVEPRVVMSTGTLHHDLNVVQVSIREHFVDGRDAFTRFVESVAADPDTTPLVHAEALAQLGDWYLAFNKYRTARDQYKEAYRVLSQSEGSIELAEEYLGNPTPLRFLSNEVDAPWHDPGENAEHGLEISMTVTRSGHLHDVWFGEGSENMTEDELGRIRKELRKTLFRPGMSDGAVVETKGHVWHYPIEPPPQESS